MDFRKIDRDDLPLLLALKKESHDGTHHRTFLNSSDQERWFDGLDRHPYQPGCLFLIAEDKLGTIVNKPVGLFKLANIDWVNRQADVGWDVFKEYRGRGLGKMLVKTGTLFAFHSLNLHRLNAEILETNLRSQRCARSAGYIKEGCKRQAIFKDGKYVDSWLYGILSEDYNNATTTGK